MNILLICNTGLSTSLVAQDIKAEFDRRGQECTINASGIDSMQHTLDAEPVEVILLAPQVKFLRKEVEKKLEGLGKQGIPLVDIQRVDYGRRNAKGIVDSILKPLGG